MATDRELEAVSAWLDGEGDLDGPLTPEAAAFRDDALALRRRFRVAVAETPPDVTDAVLARIADDGAADAAPAARRGRRRLAVWLSAAAAVLVAVAGIVTIAGPPAGGPDPAPAVTVDLGQQLLAAQFEVETFSGDIVAVERGAHPAVPERRYRGTVRYVAPERFELSLSDRTSYPEGWRPNDVEVVVADDVAWTRARRGCPVATQPACLPAEAEVTVTTDREPFSERRAAPLDVVVPLGSIAADAVVSSAPGATTLEVRTTVGRAGPLVDGLVGTGSWRRFHRTDVVVVAVAADDLTLRSVTITPGRGDDRARWARLNGYDDPPGATLLHLTVTPRPTPDGDGGDRAWPPGPPRAPDGTRSDGFVETPPGSLSLPVPDRGPEGLRLHRTGHLPVEPAAAGDERAGGGVEVAAWADGRGWLKARWTTEWSEQRLFGRPGELVRPVDLGPAGVAYLDPESGRLAVHAAGVDLVLLGTVPLDVQAELLDRLGVVGLPVPAGWREATAVEAVPAGLLRPPEQAAVRVDGDVVRIGVAASGRGAYLLTQSPATVLPPPASAEVTAVEVRGTTGRYTAPVGELEWIEAGHLVSLRSVELGVDELVAVAVQLTDGAGGRPPPGAAPHPPRAGPTHLLAWTSGGLPSDAPSAIRAAGFDATSVVSGGQLDLVASTDADGVSVDTAPDGWSIPLDALAVDPASHVEFVSPRAAPLVGSLRTGEVLLTEGSAALRGLGPGAELTMASGDVLVVAGVIDDVSGAGAEVLVTAADSVRLGVDTPRYALVASGLPRNGVESRLAAAIGAAPVRFRAPGETPYLRHGDAVLTQLEVKQRFGEFAYRDTGGRGIEIDPAWVADNVVAVDGTFGATRCHRAVAGIVSDIVDELRVNGKMGLTAADPAAGCWVPRRIAPGEAISRHAWGIAVDVAPSANPGGTFADQDPRVVEAFLRRGFTWGGEWLVPDPSHFEFVAQPG